MATTYHTERVYGNGDAVGVAILVACSMLSLISVSGVLLILGVSAVRSRRCSDGTVFVRTQAAIYFVSLLICNLAQAIGGLLNIAWIVEDRVYVGVACTAQAVIKQIGNAGPAIFSFVIAVHTLSILFLHRHWSDRTCYVIFTASWALLLLVLCIENFVLTEPEKGPYYGISSYWCWIAPTYRIARYTTDYLFMTASAAFSFILYSLAFFRLRGNISVAGNKISFHRRPEVRCRRKSDETNTKTDEQRIELYLTTVAKHMLWYPVVYTILVLPVAISRLSTFSGVSVPFSITIFTASVFMLHGFLNTVLFCTTRTILPGSWRLRFGLGGRDVSHSNRTNANPPFTGTGPASATLSVDVEKHVEIKYEAEPSPSCVGSGSPTSSTSPISLPRAHDDTGKEVDTHEHHIQVPSFPAPRDTRTGIHLEVV